MDRLERRFEPPDLDLLHDQIISSIFRALIRGQLKPGERLTEETIAVELGVSRTPVRSALRELALQGVLVMVPRRGAKVADWSLDDLEDVVHVRVMLEGLASEQAASRANEVDVEQLLAVADDLIGAIVRGDHERANEMDAKFHTSLVLSSKNSALIAAYASLELRIRMLLILEKQVYSSDSHYAEAADHHRAVCEALHSGDGILARQLIEENLNVAAKALMEWLRERSKASQRSVPEMIGQLVQTSD